MLLCGKTKEVQKMEDRAEKAKKLFKNGYNCSQSVFTAFADLYNIDEEKALKLATPFGGGYAGRRVICGAVSAMAMIAGLEEGSSTPHDKEGRTENYEKVNHLMDKVKERYGSVLCKHLKGLEKTDPPINRIDCSECVHFCAKLIDESFFKK